LKKVLSLSIMALALIAFAGSSASACGSCSAHADKATKTSAKSSCSASTNAIKASASATCSQADMEACAKKMGVSVEECQKMCSETGSMTMQKISIEGMTCTNCEASVTKAIEGVAGVQKVVSISYKDGSAVVCVDKNNTCSKTLTKAISDKGFKAEIIPAVATTTAISADAKKVCSKSCSAAEKAACAKKDVAKDAKDTK